MLSARSSGAWLVALLGLTSALFGCGPDRTWKLAYDTTDTGWVMHVWGLSPERLVTAGGSPARGQIHIVEGDTVTEQALPMRDVGGVEAPVSLMNWVHGFADDDVFVVGYEGVVLHYDGAAWTLMDTPTDQDLWGIWGAAPDDLWAVGGTARDPSVGQPTLLHYDGASWTEATVPALTPPDVTALFKIWGSSASDVYAVGVGGAVIHYDGTAWTELAVGARGGFSAVWGTGPDNVVIVGGQTSPHLSHWDGTEWRSVALTGLPGVSGVWTRGSIAHICGFQGLVATVDLETYEVVVEEADTRRQFHAAYGVGGMLWAVGGNIAGTGDAVGVAFRRELGDDE